MNFTGTETKITGSLLKDVKSVVGGLYSMNAPNAIGYLFCLNKDGRKISTGMFCDSYREITSDSWDYFLEYKTKKFYKL